ncbi:hypothetical protein NQ318_009689 [Aromia moschata]|uniref:Peptidoglycan-recognition protein n=1 Tax=Aromia moschata TaxID=1265417 RepID=A0AAV8X6W2_9CUCU|nr:hypothetical protein NQ318_009689 [Aromia moschata]
MNIKSFFEIISQSWWKLKFDKTHQSAYKNVNCLKIMALVLLILLIVCAIVATVILVNKTKAIESCEGVCLGNHRVYSKDDWGGKPPVSSVPLSAPIELVIISHSATTPCDSFETCSAMVRSFQEWHFEINLTDIGYNFIIGGDAGIYVGRGWDVRNFHRQGSLGINFIGDFNFDQLNSSMIDAAKLLVKEGLKLGKLSEQYLLVGHNQTTTRLPLSPGEIAYREIKTLPFKWAMTVPI